MFFDQQNLAPVYQAGVPVLPGHSQNYGYYQNSSAPQMLQTAQQQSWNQEPEWGSWFNHDSRPYLNDQQLVPAPTVPQTDESTWSREPELGSWSPVFSHDNNSFAANQQHVSAPTAPPFNDSTWSTEPELGDYLKINYSFDSNL